MQWKYPKKEPAEFRQQIKDGLFKHPIYRFKQTEMPLFLSHLFLLHFVTFTILANAVYVTCVQCERLLPWDQLDKCCTHL